MQKATSIDQIYNGNNLNWIKNNTLFLTIHGSHCYGTNIETSDIDYRGFCVAPKEYYIGYQKQFENYVQKEPDLTIFEIRKFFKLALDCNPNVLEILFTSSDEHIIKNNIIESLFMNKNMFLSKKAKHTFSGYAIGQLKRIQTHYKWLTNPPKIPPTRKECGLPEKHNLISADQIKAVESSIRKQLDIWNWHELENVDFSVREAIKTQFETMLLEITNWNWQEKTDKVWLSAANHIGLETNFIELLDKERKYSGKQKEYQQYINWKNTRNPARSILEEKYGYDTKHALHLVRLLRMCNELLSTGQLIVKRPDAQELLEVRNGKYSYYELIEYSEKLEKQNQELYLNSNVLPDKPNTDFLEKICINIIESVI